MMPEPNYRMRLAGSIKLLEARQKARFFDPTEKDLMEIADDIWRAMWAAAPADALVGRFLAWPLPASVASDLCVTDPNYKFPRSGTCLLTADEARQMFEHLFAKPL